MNIGPPSDMQEQEAEAWLQRLADIALGEASTFAPSLLEEAEQAHDARWGARKGMPDHMYRRLLEQLPVVTFMARLGGDDNEMYVSPQIEALLGFSQEEWVGNPVLWYECLHPEDKARWDVEFARFLMLGEPFRSVYRFVARDGHVVWVRGEVTMIRDAHGRPAYLQGIGYDITEMQRAEQQIRESLEEKEVMLKEIHHRVKNNLAVISSLFYLQSTYTQDEQTLKILQESQDRVRSMALVHETLYRSENLAAVDFAEYARNLGAQLVQSYGLSTGRIELKIDMEAVKMSVDLAVSCGLILNELVTNAVKHAFPDGMRGEIRLALHRQEEGRCVLSVADTGVGLPPNMVAATASSLGMRLIRSLTRQIDGQFELASTSYGAEARLTLHGQ